jgi:hypothetical protein
VSASRTAALSPPVPKSSPALAAIESDGTEVFVIYDGKRIAKRGHPDTPQAGTWVSIEPGYTVWDKNYPQELVIEHEGKVVSR